MKLKDGIAILIIIVSMISLILVANIPSCVDSCCGCESMTEYLFGEISSILLVIFLFVGIVLLINDKV